MTRDRRAALVEILDAVLRQNDRPLTLADLDACLMAEQLYVPPALIRSALAGGPFVKVVERGQPPRWGRSRSARIRTEGSRFPSPARGGRR
jgi:hypothetical protein